MLTLSASLLPATAGAQAFVNDPNSLTLSVGYTFGFANAIVETQGVTFDGIRSFQHALNFGVEYVAPLPGLAVTVGLPLLGLQYRGSDLPESDFVRPHGSNDDGSTHFVATDFRADVRYVIVPLEEYINVGVSVGGSIPTQNYETQGFAGAGRGLKQLHLGLAIGRTLTPILDTLYFHFSYYFTLSERFETFSPATGEVGQNYSSMAVQVGYFILPELQINVAADIRIAHGGVDFIDWLSFDQVIRDFHDVLMRENVYLVGGGIAYEVIDGMNISLLARAFVGGTNTRNAHLFGLNVSYQIF